MRKVCLIVVMLVAAAGTVVFALTLSFERTWGGPNIDNGEGVAVAPTDGSVYVAGTTNSFGTGTADGDTDAFLLKFAGNGALVWQRTWGTARTEPFTAADEFAFDVAVGPAPEEPVYITGLFGPTGGAFLVRFDANGNLVWERVWGAGSSSHAEAVAVADDGSVYVAGQSLSFGAGNGDAFLAKFAADGTLLWDRTWGGSGFDGAQDVAVAGDGSIYIAGHTQFFGNDAFVAKFSPDGTFLWNKEWREGTIADDSEALGVAVASDGNVYLTGRALRSGVGQNIFLVKFASDGALVWQKTWGAGLDAAHNVTVGADGNIYVTGNTGFGQGGGDAFVVKFLPSSGMVRQAATWGTVDNEHGASIAAAPDRSIYVAGVVRSAPPYVFARAVTATRTPDAFLGTPAATVTVPGAIVGFPTGTVTMPNGSPTFAGANDAVLLKLRP